MKHYMLDIETGATGAKAAVLAVGLIQFNPRTGAETRAMEWRLSLRANAQLGRITDPGTMEWWLQQGQAAQRALFSGQECKTGKELAEQLRVWVDQGGRGHRCVWSKGPTFDAAIMRNLFEGVGEPWPFHYRDERDVRTIEALGKALRIELAEHDERLLHGTLPDCRAQIENVVRVWGSVDVIKEEEWDEDE